MGRLFTVYYVVTVAFFLGAPARGYPQPVAQGKQNATVSSLLEDATESESVPQTNIQLPIQTPVYDDSDMYLEPEQETEQTRIFEHQTEKVFTPSEPVGRSQTFFPSFSLYDNPPLGHSRPFIFQQEAAYSQRPGAYRQQLTYDNLKYNNPFRRENYQVATDATHGLLGSGNFGVIRGGTFYNENDGETQEYNTGRYNAYAQFLHNNGHGRPSFYFGATSPRPQQNDQFSLFRDFADINTPNTAYSQYVVVYINKNDTALDNPPKKMTEQPKNIIERLQMLDLEVKKPKGKEPVKKLSAVKRKLALEPTEKKNKYKKVTTTTPSTDLYEPLLALS